MKGIALAIVAIVLLAIGLSARDAQGYDSFGAACASGVQQVYAVPQQVVVQQKVFAVPQQKVFVQQVHPQRVFVQQKQQRVFSQHSFSSGAGVQVNVNNNVGRRSLFGGRLFGR